MALASGTRFGPYEIADQIGKGGMGEVYRATDTTLERDVAIKVLPESFVADVDRVARFEQEAKTLASLNHLNIAHIYGLERSSGTTALVMELIEGPTLAESSGSLCSTPKQARRHRRSRRMATGSLTAPIERIVARFTSNKSLASVTGARFRPTGGSQPSGRPTGMSLFISKTTTV